MKKTDSFLIICLSESLYKEGSFMQITKIVITGGPCGGKSTAMRWISHVFTEAGYKVLFVPETATELICGGVAPWTCGTNAEYQKVQMAEYVSLPS